MNTRFALPVVALACCSMSNAQVVNAPFDQFYSAVDLGTIPGVPGPYGGLVISADDPNVLLIGGSANQAAAAIYRVRLVRSCGRIVGFDGDAEFFASAPNIDGGLAYGPDGVLFFTRYSMNGLGQLLPGSAAPDRLIDLNAFGVPSSVGAVNFIPPGFPNAGACRLLTFNNGAWSGVELAPAGDGTFLVTSGQVRVPSVATGPEGFVYIRAGSPEFPTQTLLVSEFSAGRVSAYEIDANADPIVATRRTFLSGLNGAEGAAIDPATNDFLFSTFGGGNRVVVVRGFNRPCPGDVTGDGVVNFADLNTVLTNFGQSGDPIAGDTNSDCLVNFADLNVVLSAFGQTCD